MNWLVGIGLFALVGICSYFGIEHHLDSKANKLSQGNEEDREMLPNYVISPPKSITASITRCCNGQSGPN